MMKRNILAGLAGLFLAACGGGGDDPDAGGGDDGPADARIDAAPPAYQVSQVLDLQTGTLVGNMAPETNTSAVLPDSDYLVWVGAYDVDENGDPSVLPKQYGVTLCASEYTPPAAETCNFTETNDAGNDNMPQANVQTVGATPRVLCGNLDARAPDADGRVDRDLFTIRLTAPARVDLRLYSATPQAMTSNFVALYNESNQLAAFGLFLGNHGVFSVSLDTGRYRVSAETYAEAMPAADAPYHLIVSTSDLETRCAASQTTTFTERADGAANTGNDVVEVRFTEDPYHALTAGADDVERSGVTLAAGMTYKLAGELAGGTNPADEYLDRDTYLVHTGPTTNQIDVRLEWPEATADLDYFFFIPIP